MTQTDNRKNRSPAEAAAEGVLQSCNPVILSQGFSLFALCALWWILKDTNGRSHTDNRFTAVLRLQKKSRTFENTSTGAWLAFAPTAGATGSIGGSSPTSFCPGAAAICMTPNQATRGDPVGSRIINETPTLARKDAIGRTHGRTHFSCPALVQAIYPRSRRFGQHPRAVVAR